MFHVNFQDVAENSHKLCTFHINEVFIIFIINYPIHLCLNIPFPSYPLIKPPPISALSPLIFDYMRVLPNPLNLSFPTSPESPCSGVSHLHKAMGLPSHSCQTRPSLCEICIMSHGSLPEHSLVNLDLREHWVFWPNIWGYKPPYLLQYICQLPHWGPWAQSDGWPQASTFALVSSWLNPLSNSQISFLPASTSSQQQ